MNIGSFSFQLLYKPVSLENFACSGITSEGSTLLLSLPPSSLLPFFPFPLLSLLSPLSIPRVAGTEDQI